eukprot:TRINITY_DN1514_c0_g1_i1.p2 TRINITY_DN1514_c0_g1~~TRINITY_DN1514_c0_g1_i1.p2  ORF type:complete len:309 (+),score=84.96 TRINITY_DN1514_c0_g1_i1:22-927(+)
MVKSKQHAARATGEPSCLVVRVACGAAKAVVFPFAVMCWLMCTAFAAAKRVACAAAHPFVVVYTFTEYEKRLTALAITCEQLKEQITSRDRRRAEFLQQFNEYKVATTKQLRKLEGRTYVSCGAAGKRCQPVPVKVEAPPAAAAPPPPPPPPPVMLARALIIAKSKAPAAPAAKKVPAQVVVSPGTLRSALSRLKQCTEDADALAAPRHAKKVVQSPKVEAARPALRDLTNTKQKQPTRGRAEPKRPFFQMEADFLKMTLKRTNVDRSPGGTPMRRASGTPKSSPLGSSLLRRHENAVVAN